MAGEKPDVLMVGAKKPVMMKGFEGKVALHHWLDAKDKALITDLVKQSLDAQIRDIVTTELGLIEKFRASGIPIRPDTGYDPAPVIAQFDKLWLPKAPAIAELRRIGATL